MISYYQFKKICDKLIVAMALPKLGGKKKFLDPNYGNAIAEIGRKKICFGNCGNGIAENGKKKILFWQLQQWHCRKWEKKKKDVTKSVKE